MRRGFFIVEPNQKQLFQIADLIEHGRIRPVVDTVIPFALAPGAYAPNAPRQRRGKLVVSIHP